MYVPKPPASEQPPETAPLDLAKPQLNAEPGQGVTHVWLCMLMEHSVFASSIPLMILFSSAG